MQTESILSKFITDVGNTLVSTDEQIKALIAQASDYTWRFGSYSLAEAEIDTDHCISFEAELFICPASSTQPSPDPQIEATVRGTVIRDEYDNWNLSYYRLVNAGFIGV